MSIEYTTSISSRASAFTNINVLRNHRRSLKPAIFQSWAEPLVDFAGLKAGQAVLGRVCNLTLLPNLVKTITATISLTCYSLLLRFLSQHSHMMMDRVFVRSLQIKSQRGTSAMQRLFPLDSPRTAVLPTSVGPYFMAIEPSKIGTPRFSKPFSRAASWP